MLRYLLLIPFFAFIAFSSSAQSSWTLEKCIEHALENNIRVKQTALQVESAKRNKDQAFADMFPSLNASSGFNVNFGRTIDPGSNQFITESVNSNNFWLGSNVTLFNGLRLLNTLKRSQLDKIAAEYDLQAISNDISMTIATSFLQVMFAEELLTIAIEQQKITEEQLTRSQKLVESGSLAKGAMYEVEAQVANNVLQVVNAENSLNSAMLTLKQLLNLRADDEFEIARPNVDMPMEDPTALRVSIIYNEAKQNWPAVLARETRLKSAEKGMSIATAGLTPTLSGSGSVSSLFSSASSYGFFNTQDTALWGEKIPYGAQLDQNLSYGFGLSLSIPIFNGLAARNGLHQARLNRLNNELQLQDTKNQLYSSVQQAYNDAISAYKTYLASDETVRATDLAFEYAQQRYDVGVMNALDFNTAKNNLARVQSERLRAKYDYIFRAKVLDFYRGKALTFAPQ